MSNILERENTAKNIDKQKFKEKAQVIKKRNLQRPNMRGGTRL